MTFLTFMLLEVLTDIGLTPNEAKIYAALLDLHEASIDAVTKHSGVHRRNTYDALGRLVKKGLVFQVLPKKILTFAPVDPNKLFELVEEKEKSLKDILPEMQLKFKRKPVSQSVYIYKGVGGLKNYIDLILKEKKNIYGIGSKGTWFDPRIRKFAVRAGKELKKKNIKSHLIFDQEIKEHPEILKIIGKDVKFLPKKYSSGSSVDIFGDYVAIYSGVNVKQLEEEITVFILKDKTLAKDYMKWWRFMWDMLP